MSFKVSEFDFDGEREWIYADSEESAKETLLAICGDREEAFEFDAVEVRVLTDEELGEHMIYDEDEEPSLTFKEAIDERVEDEGQVCFHLCGTTY